MALFIPLRDDNPHRFIGRAWVTWGLIALNCSIYILFMSGWVYDAFVPLAMSFGLIPSILLDHAQLPEAYALIPAWLTPATALFLHQSVLHLAGNMLFLWIFGDNVEDGFGHTRFCIFYMLTGMLSGIVYALFAPLSDLPMIGASGALAGIIAAYLLLYPRTKIWVLLIIPVPVHIPALLAIGAWIAIQMVYVLRDGTPDVAWLSHISGFVIGLILTPLLKRRSVLLLGREPQIDPARLEKPDAP